MPVYYDDNAGEIAVASENCPSCGSSERRYDGSCDAPGCTGIRFKCCGVGCDEDDPNGRCAKAAAQESDDERDARINRERAAFGLRPL